MAAKPKKKREVVYIRVYKSDRVKINKIVKQAGTTQ